MRRHAPAPDAALGDDDAAEDKDEQDELRRTVSSHSCQFYVLVLVMHTSLQISSKLPTQHSIRVNEFQCMGRRSITPDLESGL